MVIRSENTTMQGEVDMLKGRAAIHRDLDGVEKKTNRNFSKFNIQQEQNLAIQGND